jgi:hypothetical protein
MYPCTQQLQRIVCLGGLPDCFSVDFGGMVVDVCVLPVPAPQISQSLAANRVAGTAFSISRLGLRLGSTARGVSAAHVRAAGRSKIVPPVFSSSSKGEPTNKPKRTAVNP